MTLTAEKSCFPFTNEIDRYTFKGALQDAGIDADDFLAQVK